MSDEIVSLTPGDPQWPTRLDDIPSPPTRLWVRGNADLLKKRSVAIVGSRSCTVYGETMARDIAHSIASIRYVIVSGAAFGIDAAAHRGALTANGATIAVLACGVDRAYPAAHSDLLAQILAKGGAVVSEMEPGTAPVRSAFLARNRIITGLSGDVVLVEAVSRSGSMNAVAHAGQQGRRLHAVPGPVTSLTSQGPNSLIRARMAQLVTCGSEVVEAESCAERQEYAQSVTDSRWLPYLTRGESSEQCLDAGLNCSIDPLTGRCTECGKAEDL